MSSRAVGAGCVYWVTIAGLRMRVRAMEPCRPYPGWWRVEPLQGGCQLILPVTSEWSLDPHAPGSSGDPKICPPTPAA